MSIPIDDLAQEIIGGRRLSRNDDVHFFETCNLAALCQGADSIREQLCGNKVSLCAIINGEKVAIAVKTVNFARKAVLTLLLAKAIPF
ncbi:MAG: hypothetical protein ACTTJ7_08090 [Treponema sp.]